MDTSSSESSDNENDLTPFPTRPESYELRNIIGAGGSSQVWEALCTPMQESVAVKIIELDKVSTSIDEIRREIQVMRMCNHPNVVRYHCSFVAGSELWLIMPLLACGSCLDIIRHVPDFSTGINDEVILATILRELLKGLQYFHRNGQIHRDVKAGNVLVDTDGSVQVSDFGVSAVLVEDGVKRSARNTFVGTPCWMAPEVMEQVGYNFKADIWSFGITVIELATGQVPNSRLTPMKVVVTVVEGRPPALRDYTSYEYSSGLRDLVKQCLQKDPKKRPTADKLLKHSFFKKAKTPSFLADNLAPRVPPLHTRVETIRRGLVATHGSEAVARVHRQRGATRGHGESWDFGEESADDEEEANPPSPAPGPSPRAPGVGLGGPAGGLGGPAATAGGEAVAGFGDSQAPRAPEDGGPPTDPTAASGASETKKSRTGRTFNVMSKKAGGALAPSGQGGASLQGLHVKLDDLTATVAAQGKMIEQLLHLVNDRAEDSLALERENEALRASLARYGQ